MILLVHSAQNRKCIDNVVLANPIDWPIVNKKFKENVEVQLGDSFFVIFDVFGKTDLILHVLDFFLGGVESHTSHHVCNCF